MKVFISLPMSGHENTIIKRYVAAVAFLKESYPDAIPVQPEIIDKNPLFTIIPSSDDFPSNIAKDIEELLRCDALLLTQGWKDSRGCRVEQAVALAERMTIYEMPFASKQLPISDI